MFPHSSLNRNETLDLKLQFNPDRAGDHVSQFAMVCDNCQLKEVTLAGEGCVVVINIESVDGQPPLFEQGGSSSQESIDFAEVRCCRRCASAGCTTARRGDAVGVAAHIDRGGRSHVLHP